MVDEGQQTLWNADSAIINLILSVKVQAGMALTSWNLEQAYWLMRDFRREADAKLNTTKKKKYNVKDPKDSEKTIEKEMTEEELVDFLLEELGLERQTFLESEKDNEALSRFYMALEEFYMILSRILKEHGLWLREGEDPNQAFRRR